MGCASPLCYVTPYVSDAHRITNEIEISNRNIIPKRQRTVQHLTPDGLAKVKAVHVTGELDIHPLSRQCSVSSFAAAQYTIHEKTSPRGPSSLLCCYEVLTGQIWAWRILVKQAQGLGHSDRHA